MNRVVLTILAALAVAGTAAWMFHNKHSTNSRFMMSSLPTPAADAWNHWKQKFGKAYGTDSEETYRQGVWYKNFQAVNNNNAQNNGLILAMNEFGDLSFEEFSALKLGFKNTQTPSGNATFTANPQAPLPTEVDWRTKDGVLAPVQNQGQCGSCWAFAAVAAMESGAAVKSGKAVQKLSEQQLVDCATGTWGNDGCNGGLPDLAFKYAIAKGMTSEDKYPYRGSDQKCAYDDQAVTKVKAFVDVAKDENSLAQAVVMNPVAVGVAAGLAWQFYFGGVMAHWQCPASQANHGVVVVGYTADYWIVRNSWGSGWGHSGYIYMRRGYNTCGITQAASYPTF